MKGHGPARVWIVVTVAGLFIAAHALLFRALSHKALSAAVLSGVVILIVIKLGLVGSAYGLVRRRRQSVDRD